MKLNHNFYRCLEAVIDAALKNPTLGGKALRDASVIVETDIAQMSQALKDAEAAKTEKAEAKAE